MLEAALYTALGFAVASLLALLVAPAVWRQAVRITRRRIEASVPLTLNEIQADKDQLRAEFAMSTRRLEMTLDKLRERDATQVIEVQRKRDQLSKAVEELREREAELKAAEAKGTQLAADLEAREDELAATRATLAETSADLEKHARKLADYEAALKAATADVDSHKQQLAARDARLDHLGTEAARLRADLETARAELETQKVEIAAARLSATDGPQGDNAFVRERLSDLAARVTLMTAEMEGAGSPAERILRETPKPDFPPEAYDTPDGRPPESLADRIHALKQVAAED